MSAFGTRLAAWVLLTPDAQPDLDLFMAVTTELGDVVLGPPGTLPADLDDAKRA